VRTLLESAYFCVSLALGKLLRSARYSKTRIVYEDGERQVRKHRVSYAPLLIWMGDLLSRVLDNGVRVLPQGDWEERERQVYTTLRGSAIRIDAGGTLVLPRLDGQTLADLLENPEVEESVRERAIELAVVALKDFHSRGFTHGDAMAENVMVDLEVGIAHWFDFETMHDSSRPKVWRRADDVRALLATSLLRCNAEQMAEAVQRILDVYGDDEVTELLRASFTSVLRRPLAFHLGQAALSLRHFRETAHLLRERLPRAEPTRRPAHRTLPP
jgi:hypothetical protein